MPTKLVLQQRGANGLNTAAELPTLENGKIDMSWLPVVGESGAAIIERGSNANGEYVRWADGTQICMYRGSVAQAENSTAGKTFVFPAAFLDASSLRLVSSPSGIVSTGSSATTVVECQIVSSSQYKVKILVPSGNGVTASTSTLGFYALAIGRWK